MAITVNTQPSTVTPSRNPVRWVMTTDNYVASAGVAAVKKFTVTGAVSAFEQVTIAYDDLEFTITTVNSPAAATGYNMPTGDGGTTHKGNMLLYFMANYYLNRDFVITLVGNDFIFTARETGAAYNITGTDTFANGAWSTTTTGVTVAYQDNFFICVDVMVEETHLSGTYTRIKTLYLKPNSSSQVDFDIQDALHAFVRFLMNAPTYAQSAYSQCNNINKRYKIQYFESYGATPVAYAVTESSVKRFIKGGIKRESWPAYASNFLTSYINIPLGQNTNKFLTTRNVKRWATKSSPEYLYLCTGAAITNARLRARVHYSNNTQTTTTIASYASLGGNLTFLFPAGFDALNLGSLYPLLTPTHWYVYVDNSSGALKSEMVMFTVQETAHLDRYFIYESSLGSFETLRTHGQAEYGVEVEKEEFEKIAGAGYAATDSDIVAGDSYYREGTEVFTGFRSKSELLELIDMVKSRYCFEVVGGVHVPVLIDKGSFSFYRDDSFGYGIKFVYKPAYNQINAGVR